jgi:lipoyl(octanoyl) transferase
MPSDLKTSVYVRQLGRRAYVPVWQAMSRFTDARTSDTPDEIWLVEHDPVFTQGQAGKAEHVLAPGDIPVVQVDRGGQVTYHGPGQQVGYLLVDLRRKGLGVRAFVTGIEQAIVNLAADYGIVAAPRADAPGVYVDGAKLCSLGLRIRKGKSFHGLALNVHMNMEPFHRINPCGLVGIRMTQLSELGGPMSLTDVAEPLVGHLMETLGYHTRIQDDERQLLPTADIGLT